MSSQTTIEAVDGLPAIRIEREFAATPEQVFRAHMDPELFVQWIGPRSVTNEMEYHDARTGGNYSFVGYQDGERIARFYGSFHEVRKNERIVQTFCFDGSPDDVALETLTLTDLGNGRTRLEATSLVGSFEARDAMLESGMEVGIREGYEKLDALMESS